VKGKKERRKEGKKGKEVIKESRNHPQIPHL
jgi:hypothetical protein